MIPYSKLRSPEKQKRASLEVTVITWVERGSLGNVSDIGKRPGQSPFGVGGVGRGVVDYEGRNSLESVSLTLLHTNYTKYTIKLNVGLLVFCSATPNIGPDRPVS